MLAFTLFQILHRILLLGEMPRGEAERVTGLKERSARMVLAQLISDGILDSVSNFHMVGKCGYLPTQTQG